MEKVTCPRCGEENGIKSKYCLGCGYELSKTRTESTDNQFKSPISKVSDTRKKLLSGIISAIIFGLTYFVVQQVFFKPPSFDKIMTVAASELNKTCPIMVDQYTRLDNVIALPDNIFQYNYTLVDMDKSEVNIDTIKKYFEPNIINSIKTEPELKIYRDNKTTMNYNYRDKNGVFVIKFSITPDMYK